MSIVQSDQFTEAAVQEPPVSEQVSADRSIGTPLERMSDILDNVANAIAPVWPLKDFVAVNPYLGHSDISFLKARRLLRSVSDCEMLMPLSYYQQRFHAGEFSSEDVADAVEEINSEYSQARLSLSSLLPLLSPSETPASEPANTRQLRTICEFVDRLDGTDWSAKVKDEIGRHCAAHYDEGQAVWQSPWKDLPLYQAWRSAVQQDRRLELLGMSGCREFFASLPHTPEATVVCLLDELNVPEEMWESFLLCQAHSVSGWSSYTRYKSNQEADSADNQHFTGLLAIRLAYDVALSKASALNLDWTSLSRFWHATGRSSDGDTGDGAIRLALLRATEIAWQRNLLSAFDTDNSGQETSPESEHTQSLAQMVFCIDVRSERYRRNIESVSDQIETFGFAGFFGMPIAIQGLGESEATSQVPALLSPSFTVTEGVRDAAEKDALRFSNRRGLTRSLRKTWKQFQSSATGCFGFVESSGLAFGWKLLSKSVKTSGRKSQFDGVPSAAQGKLGPNLSSLEQSGIDYAQQLQLATSALKGIGLTEGFGKFVVFCGHGSQTQNNPLKAGLDCGACCGHSGEPNARFAAALLNQPEIRKGLAEQGINIPEQTHFLAALHNTTNDEVEFFDTDLLSDSQRSSLNELADLTSKATAQTQLERMPQVNANSVGEVSQRAMDWSEVRPEWGLAGNASFIVAPRKVTQNANLDGRSFLHSYDYRNDDGFQVLEQIMTAPMVVGHWINMQYYASTVDNVHYGSGSKTIHNVVGKFGIFSGNGGDLTTGLPWQSVHNGDGFQHEPLRLLSVIAAPRDAVADIIERNKVVEDLVVNGWMNLVVLDDGEFYRYTTRQVWEPVSAAKQSTAEVAMN